MKIIASQINPKSEDFQSNARAMNDQIADFESKLAQIRMGGSDEARKKHTERGKLLTRDRINHLVDPGSPFLELSSFAGYNMYGEDVPAAGIITGIGRVSGRDVVVIANDPTVKGNLLPHDGEKTFAGPGHRRAK